MVTLAQDLRFAARRLRRAPGFTAAAGLTLTLGIGANTAIFSVLNAVLLHPLPFPEAERLVLVWDDQPGYGEAPASLPEFEDWRRLGEPLEAAAAHYGTNVNVAGPQEPERARRALVSAGFFDLVGARAILGRTFSAEEHAVGGLPVVVLSHGFWQRHLAAKQDVVGSSLRLDDVPFTVVGVLGPGVPSLGDEPEDLWVALEAHAPWRERRFHFLTVLARLRPDVELESAQTQMAAIGRRLAEESQTPHGAILEPLRERWVGDQRPALFALLGAVGMVLLIAAVNVANLSLARAAGRGEEMAVRRALGAGRGRLVRQLLIESAVLGGLGAGLGLGVGSLGVRAIAAAWPSAMPPPPWIGIDLRVLAFTIGVAGGAVLLFGLGPALGGSAAAGMGRGRVGPGAAGRRLRHALVVSEIALALVLLVGAGLLLRSFGRLLRTDLGFRAEGVFTFELNLPASRYGEREQRRAFWEELSGRLAALPGVVAASAANNLPLAGSMSGDFSLADRPPFPPGESPSAEKRIVSPEYFEVMGIPLLQGRGFTAADREGSLPVVVVSESLARRLWPDENPVGRRLRSLLCGSTNPCWEEIVGVVADVRVPWIAQITGFEIYYPSAQIPLSGLAVALRTVGDARPLAGEARRVVREIDPQQPIHNVRTLDAIVGESLGDRRLSTALLGLFGALALVLAAVGIGGVVSYAVAQRRREFGVRVALGATPRALLHDVLGQGMKLVGGGLVAGLVGALALTRVLRAQLFAVSPADPATYAAAVVVLVACALLACAAPARRAATVEPMDALRDE